MKYRDILDSLASEDRLRTIPEGYAAGVDLLSNDYMALAAHAPEFRRELSVRFPEAPLSSSASRLLSGQQDCHRMLESRLTELYGRPALIFNSGYHANIGLLQALAVKGSLIVADKLIHASSIDGIRLSGADFIRFRHNDMHALHGILATHSDRYDRIIVATEAIFSMDGDIAPLTKLVQLKHEFPNMMLLLDEAHSFGVRGTHGLGLAEEMQCIEDVDVIMGTLGKAAASSGAFAIASPELISLLVNTARPFIFSTAIPPICCAWSLLMIEKLVDMQPQRLHLHRLSANFAQAIADITGTPVTSASQIVPLVTGDAASALRLAKICRDAGFNCMAIRRPTVPPHGERVRFSLNADLQTEQLNPLTDIIREFYLKRL